MSWLLNTLSLSGLLLLLSSFTPVSDARPRKLKLCKVDYFFECVFEPMMMFTGQANGTGVPMNDQEFEQFCFNNHDFFPYCAKQWLKRCGNDIHTEIITKLILEAMQDSVNKFCDPQGYIRPTFLKHAQCMVEQVKITPKYRRTCIRQLQANYEWSHAHGLQTDFSQLLRGQCCSQNAWEQCIVGQISEECGKEAGDIFPNLMKTLSFSIFEMLCPVSEFNPNNEEKCPPEIYKAPEDFNPKGIKSWSFLSHYFSYICPNVGWGVDESKDF